VRALVIASCAATIAIAAACHAEPAIVTATTVAGGVSPDGGDDDDTANAALDGVADASADGDSSLGNMFGDEIGESFGAGGLGLSGLGEGPGSGCDDAGRPRGEGIGLGNFGNLNHGAGGNPCSADAAVGTGQGLGSRTRPDAGRRPSPQMREVTVDVGPGLPPEVVRRIVRQHFGQLRLCYMNGLATSSQLAGAVAVTFTIDASGAVVGARDNGSTLPDPAVVSCAVAGFAGLSFPVPYAPPVQVKYAISFAPHS
jgi:hypothetical protein